MEGLIPGVDIRAERASPPFRFPVIDFCPPTWSLSEVHVPRYAHNAQNIQKERIYVIGSLRNAKVPEIANQLRHDGYEVFDDWYAAGPEADDHWKTYEQTRGRSYKQALEGACCANTFNFDRTNIDKSDIGVMIMPAGKSGHTELGYMAGKGKRTFVLLEADVDRWDIMYKFFTGVAYNYEELLNEIRSSR